MERLIDFESLRFGEPLYLWLLLAPALLFVLWCWQLVRRRGVARRYRTTRLVPIRERFAHVGELAFWLALIAASALTILALSRPQGITAIVRSPGVDLVLLMDGSTSMRVRDMGVDRWQRAMQWMRTLTKTLSWQGDRIALATFADIAVPQIRLTRDPNTILFFLDHLEDEPTFRLENDTSWNTNVEDAIYWGVKLVETDQEMYGPTKNAKTFVVVSDGQVWSGNVERAIAQAVQRGIAVDVIGVGTSNGGLIPLPRDEKGVVLAGYEAIRSTLDRTSLREIARAGGGEYFELGTSADDGRRSHHTERRAALGERPGHQLDEPYASARGGAGSRSATVPHAAPTPAWARRRARPARSSQPPVRSPSNQPDDPGECSISPVAAADDLRLGHAISTIFRGDVPPATTRTLFGETPRAEASVASAAAFALPRSAGAVTRTLSASPSHVSMPVRDAEGMTLMVSLAITHFNTVSVAAVLEGPPRRTPWSRSQR
jgi:Ca-activated chloride channel family protein